MDSYSYIQISALNLSNLNYELSELKGKLNESTPSKFLIGLGTELLTMNPNANQPNCESGNYDPHLYSLRSSTPSKKLSPSYESWADMLLQKSTSFAPLHLLKEKKRKQELPSPRILKTLSKDPK